MRPTWFTGPPRWHRSARDGRSRNDGADYVARSNHTATRSRRGSGCCRGDRSSWWLPDNGFPRKYVPTRADEGKIRSVGLLSPEVTGNAAHRRRRHDGETSRRFLTQIVSEGRAAWCGDPMATLVCRPKMALDTRKVDA